MQIIHYLVQAACFFFALLTLNIVWENVKGYGAEKKYGYCLLYLAGGAAVFALMVALTNLSSRLIQ